MQRGSISPSDIAAPQHHPAIRSQAPVTVLEPPDSYVDFLGTKTRRSFDAGMYGSGVASPAQVVTPSHPSFDDEYFEWVDILETVDTARDSYTFIELGAGYGRWSMRAAMAARRKAGCRFSCVAVEAEPDHFRWLLDHFRDNDVDPAEHELIWAAVGAHPGFVPFWVGEADSWYGQAVAKKARDPLPDARGRRRMKARSVLGRPPVVSTGEKTAVWVPCITLAEVLTPYRRVDLVDVDIQGAEVGVLSSAIELLNERVRRVHIGTHSAKIEDLLRALFTAHRWRKLNDYPCLRTSPTPYGDITFQDGVQTWVNPNRDGAARRTAAPRASGKDVRTRSANVDELHARVDALEGRVRILKNENSHLQTRYQATREKLRRAPVPRRLWPIRLVARVARWLRLWR